MPKYLMPIIAAHSTTKPPTITVAPSHMNALLVIMVSSSNGEAGRRRSLQGRLSPNYL
jgi:hypothetical protein